MTTTTQRQKRGHCLVAQNGHILAAYDTKEMAQHAKECLVKRGDYLARELRVQGFGGWIVIHDGTDIVASAHTLEGAVLALYLVADEEGYDPSDLSVCLALQEVISDWKAGFSWCWNTDEVRFRGKALIVAALDKSWS